jgi:hypothetical protein
MGGAVDFFDANLDPPAQPIRALCLKFHRRSKSAAAARKRRCLTVRVMGV